MSVPGKKEKLPLSVTHPDLARELADADPSKLSKGSHKYCTWKCALDHQWKATVKDRTAGYGCPYCSGNKTLTGFNDLSTTHPELARELIDAHPSKLSKGSHKYCTWKCALDHQWKATVKDRTAGYGCPYCSGNKILRGFNDLSTTHPELARELVDYNPSRISRGSKRICTWECTNSHKWRTTVQSRSSGDGCPSCAKSGFDPNEDSFLYFIENPKWEMYQIGITNIPDDRLKDHKKLGWKTIELRGPMDGHLTQQWETAILRMLKAKGADLSNSKIAGKFDGYSEAWSKSTFEVKSIKELMRLTEEFEENGRILSPPLPDR
jgi:hypothetical protein